MTEPTPNDRTIDFLMRDSEKRHQYQHEFSLAGFKTLILMNGGAIISLLTYVGHSSNGHMARQLSEAFIWYVVGLVSVVLAYLAAYASQGSFLNASGGQAWRELGMDGEQKPTPEQHEAQGNTAIAIGVVLCVVSLAAFIGGSWRAMTALS